MTFVLLSEDDLHILDQFDYHIARCDGKQGEQDDIAAGVTDRAHLHSLIREHINAHWHAVFCELGLWSILTNRNANLLSPSFPLRGVRLALEQSLAARGTL